MKVSSLIFSNPKSNASISSYFTAQRSLSFYCLLSLIFDVCGHSVLVKQERDSEKEKNYELVSNNCFFYWNLTPVEPSNNHISVQVLNKGLLMGFVWNKYVMHCTNDECCESLLNLTGTRS